MIASTSGGIAMAQPRMRPRFALDLACTIEDVMAALRERLPDNAQGLEGVFSKRHGTVKVPDERWTFWSPQLGLTVESIDDDDHRTRVRGVFSPHPHIWTAFVFAYLTLFVLGFFGLMYGFAQLGLGRTPTALYVPATSATLGAGLYAASFIGQGLGAGEMYYLRSYLDECLEAAEQACLERPKTSRDSAQL
jgi:hypothetical protein